MPFLFVQKQRALFDGLYNKQGPLYLHDMFLPAGKVKPLGNNFSLYTLFSSTYGLNSFSYNDTRL